MVMVASRPRGLNVEEGSGCGLRPLWSDDALASFLVNCTILSSQKSKSRNFPLFDFFPIDSASKVRDILFLFQKFLLLRDKPDVCDCTIPLLYGVDAPRTIPTRDVLAVC